MKYFNNLPHQYINSPILKEVFNRSYNETKSYADSNFHPLSTADKDMMLSQLHDFKSQVDTIHLNEAKLESFKSNFSFFRDRNFVQDQKISEFKERVLSWQQKSGLNVDNQDIGLTDLQSTTQFLIEHKDEVVSVIEHAKPLGSFGDITINELINKGTDALSPILNTLDPNLTLNGGFTILSSLFFYRVVVNLYTKSAYNFDFKGMNPTEVADFKASRPRDIRFFMLCCAPLITASLVTMAKLNPLNINLNIEMKEAVTSNVSILAFLTKNKPEWFKSLLKIVLSLVFIIIVNNYTGTNPIGLLLANPFFYNLFKLFFILGSIMPLLAIFFYILTIYLFIQFSEGKINMPIYLPQFILEWLAEIKKLSKVSAKGTIIGYYFKLIVIYALIFVFLVIFLLFIF